MNERMPRERLERIGRALGEAARQIERSMRGARAPQTGLRGLAAISPGGRATAR
jgi:hypothetical protein